jgi:hypothetical protein
MNRYNIIRCQITLPASPFDTWLTLLISLRSEIESNVATECHLSVCLSVYLSCLSIYLPTYLYVYLICGSTALVDLGRFFSFLILYTVGSTLLAGDQPVTRPLPTHRAIQTQNKRTQTSVPRVRFEPTIPVFERAKTVHALESRQRSHCDRHRHLLPRFYYRMFAFCSQQRDYDDPRRSHV